MPASLAATVIGTTDPIAHAAFYRDLLGWDVVNEQPDWVRLRDPERERPGLSFQLEADDPPPVWPDPSGGVRMQAHLDVLVGGPDELAAEIGRATALGAHLEDYQPQDGVRVMRDPYGHLFCLFVDGA